MNEFIEILKAKQDDSGTSLVVRVPGKHILECLKRFSIDGAVKGELRIDDGRRITAEQRKMAYATIRDISIHTGHLPEELKEWLKYDYMAQTGQEYFSLADCSVTTGRMFIDHLIEFCFKWDIPLQESGLNRNDDIGRYLWLCLRYRKCCICGKPGEVHHIDTIGMGRDRKTVDDSENEKICLCRGHHVEAHTIGVESFAEKYHVYGIKYVDE